MTRPAVVGVVGSRIGAAAAAEIGYGRRELDAYDLGCMVALARAGMAPVGIGSLEPVADQVLDVVDGLVLSPAGRCAGPGPRAALHPAPTVRALVREARRRRVPVLAICGGIAGLLAPPADGGSVAVASAVGGSEVPQSVQVVDLALQEVLGGEVAVALPHLPRSLAAADGLAVAAVTGDGSVAALSGITVPVLAVWWHPESLPAGDPAREGVFRWLRRSIAARVGG